MTSDDAEPGVIRVNTELNLDEILAGVQRDRELHPVKSNNKLVARVPMTVYEQSIHENWDEERWKRWLNDPQNDPFRVWRGQV
jgi:hypothetical protein